MPVAFIEEAKKKGKMSLEDLKALYTKYMKTVKVNPTVTVRA
jgi:hypothetical protein